MSTASTNPTEKYQIEVVSLLQQLVTASVANTVASVQGLQKVSNQMGKSLTSPLDTLASKFGDIGSALRIIQSDIGGGTRSEAAAERFRDPATHAFVKPKDAAEAFDMAGPETLRQLTIEFGDTMEEILTDMNGKVSETSQITEDQGDVNAKTGKQAKKTTKGMGKLGKSLAGLGIALLLKGVASFLEGLLSPFDILFEVLGAMGEMISAEFTPIFVALGMVLLSLMPAIQPVLEALGPMILIWAQLATVLVPIIEILVLIILYTNPMYLGLFALAAIFERYPMTLTVVMDALELLRIGFQLIADFMQNLATGVMDLVGGFNFDDFDPGQMWNTWKDLFVDAAVDAIANMDFSGMADELGENIADAFTDIDLNPF